MKRRSNTNRLPEPVFFIDRDLGRHKMVNALRAAGLRVIAHDDEFPQNTPDEVWLAEIAKRGWFFVSRNKNQKYVKREIDAIFENGGRGFYFSGNSKCSHQDRIDAFLELKEKIENIARSRNRAFIASISAGKNPSVKVMMNLNRWKAENGLNRKRRIKF